MSKFAAINTLDYRLSMMGFYHPDSTKTREYISSDGRGVVVRCKRDDMYGMGWYWYVDGTQKGYSFSKRLLIQQMEKSGEYNV